MPDRYQNLVNSPLGKQIADALGLPVPEQLRRYEPGQPVLHGPALVGGADGGRLRDPVLGVMKTFEVDIHTDALVDAEGAPDGPFGALVYDASGITDGQQLRAAYDFFHPTIRHLKASGRVLILGTPPEECRSPREATAQRALEGFMRSVGKELRKGATAQLVQVTEGAEAGLESTLRFLLSARSAFVSGQVIRVGPADSGEPSAPADWTRPLEDKVALVTGAAQGIGESIAEILARDGAHVVCLDVPAQGEALASVANRIGGATLQVDITDDDAPDVLVDYLESRHDGLDILVHNAGITRDKSIVGMDEQQWDSVIAVNLSSQERINERLFADDVLRDGGRIVCISSVSGIAGNKGQTNYAASKAGIIGMVQALAADAAERRSTINAVAPGFIETEMTAEMPLVPREVGRRMNSLGQGGLPVDVAETVSWLANPGSAWLNGNVVRVGGQGLIGA